MMKASLYSSRSGVANSFDKIADFTLGTDGSAQIVPDPDAMASPEYAKYTLRLASRFEHPEARFYSRSEDRNIPITDGQTFLLAMAEHYDRNPYFLWEWDDNEERAGTRSQLG